MKASKKKAAPEPVLEFADEAGALWRQGELAIRKGAKVDFVIPPVHDRRSLLMEIRRVRLGAEHLLRVCWEIDSLVRKNRVTFPDLGRVLGLPTPPELLPAPRRKWKLREGSDAALMHRILVAAGDDGLTEDEIVEKLRSAGRLARASDARRSVHWGLTNLAKRAGDIFRDAADKRWRYRATG